MKHWQALGLLTVALAAAPATAHAQLAYTAKDVNVRAGPAKDYPLVARLPQGMAISVDGCLPGYQWCDVVAGRTRGWVYGANIVYPYQGANVPVLTYGAMIGIGVVAFSVASYWDRYYVGRPWYPQRQIWISKAPPGYYGPGGYRPPPPRYGPGGPPHHPPPPGYRPGGPAQLPPPDYRPRPPAHGQGPGNGQRPPQGQGPGGGQRPPQGQGPGGGQRPQPLPGG